MHHSTSKSFCLLILVALAAGSLRAAEADVRAVTSAGATEDPASAMKRFRVAPGFKLDLFAAEPLIQNVVSFAFDEQGRCYVVESHRRRTSVFDIRNFPEWLDTDFSFRTVEDRAGFFRRTFPAPGETPNPPGLAPKKNPLRDLNGDGALDWRDLQVEGERVRLLVDTNRDGRADAAATFAEGFNGLTSGVAAGVMARQGEVWFTCIPDLWKLTQDELRTTKGLPKLEQPANPARPGASVTLSNMLSGFGVHIAFGGHDMHGLRLGPDRRVYFTIADRGTSTNLWERITDKWPGLTLEALADSGAVFRCRQDGSEFEVVAIGLRNPQELAFDDQGHLFAGDNNGDGGDKARWIHVVPGADYGWRMGWQWLPKMGAWNSEMLWGQAPSNTSAYYLPPVAHIGAGPAGVAYYPGTGLPASYDRHFFMCDFRGGPNSVVRSFALRPKGASFEAHDESEFLTGPLCTDVDFGVDGAVYVSDWVKGWEKTAQGRIYRLAPTDGASQALGRATQELLSEGMTARKNEDLVRWLGHRDQRVRLEAQWELTARALQDTAAYNAVALSSTTATNRTARLHAIWVLGEVAREGRKPGGNRMNSANARMKLAMIAQSAVGDWKGQAAREHGSSENSALWFKDLILQGAPADQLLAIEGLMLSLRQSAGNPKWPTSAALAHSTLVQVLRQNADKDAYVRHAAALALARLGNVEALLVAARDASPSVRLGAVLALRRLGRPEVMQRLSDAEPQIALEAARAIYDVPIRPAYLALAGLKLPPVQPDQTRQSTALARRILAVNYRLGAPSNARFLAETAAGSAPESWRLEALEWLGNWARPAGRDPVVGLWRPLPERNPALAARVLEPKLAALEHDGSPAIQQAARKAALALGLRRDESVPTSGNSRLAKLALALEQGTVTEKQQALATLGTLEEDGAGRLLGQWLDQLIAGKVARELQLDVLEAVQKNPKLAASSSVKDGLARYDSGRDSKDALARWRECLYGGNAEEGKKTFIERQDAACFRCHKVGGEGGEVGPELTGVGGRQTREYLLESILYPNKAVAAGFETVTVVLKSGSAVGGMLKSETATELVINSPEDGLITVKKADITARERGLSAMPEELGNILSKTDLRNLVEFLSTLK